MNNIGGKGFFDISSSLHKSLKVVSTRVVHTNTTLVIVDIGKERDIVHFTEYQV